MEGQLELQLLAALAGRPAPPHVVRRRLHGRPAETSLYAALQRLEDCGFVLRLRGRAYRPTRHGLALLNDELVLAELLAAR
ncbi:MAG: hypothetical protein ACXVZ4_08780 [Gaiellaceae bacterium]